MKKNSLFINTFWLFVCGFLGIFYYVCKRPVDNEWILLNTTSIIKTFWVPTLLAIISLSIAFFLDKCSKSKSLNIDFALMEILIIVSMIAATLMLIVGHKIPYAPKGYLKVFHYFIIGGILGYILFLSLIFLLKACYKLIFTDLKEDNIINKIYLLFTPTIIWSGVLACLIHAKLLVYENTVHSVKEYLLWINKGTLILIIVAAVFSTLSHVLASLNTKNGKTPITCAFIGLFIGIILALISIFNNNIHPNFKHLFEVSLFIFGSYLIPLFMFFLCYALRPFIEMIRNNGTDVDNCNNKLKEEKIKAKEDNTNINQTLIYKKNPNNKEDISLLEKEIEKLDFKIKEIDNKLEKHLNLFNNDLDNESTENSANKNY